MKQQTKNLTAIIIAMMVIASACKSNNSNGNNVSEKDISVGSANQGAKLSSLGLATVNAGLSAKDSYLAIDGKRMENNEVKVGNKISVVFEGIEGLKEKNGKVFPMLQIVVMDEATNAVVLQSSNLLLKSDAGYDLKDASVLSGIFTIDNSFKQGRSYIVSINVADTEGDGAIAARITLKVK